MELKNYTIKDIESMSAADLASFAEEVETIKGHTVYYFVKHGAELLHTLSEAERKNAENFDYWRGAFLHEMFNHEYGINWQADYDICACFGNCEGVKDYTNRAELFAACGFNATQRSAYDAARREYYRQQKNAENY